MPYRHEHSCLLDKNATEIVGTKEAKTKWGIVRIVLAKNSEGKVVARNIQFPGSIPVHIAQNLCKSRGGEFSPVTPINPQKQLLSEYPTEGRMELIEKLVEEFEMPFEAILSNWTREYISELPDSCFAIVLLDGSRYLPYKDKEGKLDSVGIQNALAKLNQIKCSASFKRKALTKLLIIARSIGMQMKDEEKFKLSDLNFYLGLLEEAENATSNA